MNHRINKAFEVLELTNLATLSKVKKQYYALAKKYHPDSGAASASQQKFIEITDAYQLLLDYFENPSKFSVYQDIVSEEKDSTEEFWKGRFASKEEWLKHLELARQKADKKQQEIFEAQKRAYLKTKQPVAKWGHLFFTLLAFLIVTLLLVDSFSPYQEKAVKILEYDLLFNDNNYPVIDFVINNGGKNEHIIVNQDIIYERSMQTTESVNVSGVLYETKYLRSPMKFALKLGENKTSAYEVQEHSFLRKVSTMCVFLSFIFTLYLIRPKDYTIYVFTFYFTWVVTAFGMLILLVNGTGERILNFLWRLF